jgi:hypothetical protein
MQAAATIGLSNSQPSQLSETIIVSFSYFAYAVYSLCRLHFHFNARDGISSNIRVSVDLVIHTYRLHYQSVRSQNTLLSQAMRYRLAYNLARERKSNILLYQTVRSHTKQLAKKMRDHLTNMYTSRTRQIIKRYGTNLYSRCYTVFKHVQSRTSTIQIIFTYPTSTSSSSSYYYSYSSERTGFNWRDSSSFK